MRATAVKFVFCVGMAFFNFVCLFVMESTTVIPSLVYRSVPSMSILMYSRGLSVKTV